MKPLVASQHPSLYPHHYFVDDDGNLSAYEYMEAPGPDLSGHQAFVQEFCQLIQERGLQQKLGLSLRHEEESVSTFELEFPAKRTCIDVPHNIPLPYSKDSVDTMTEFLHEDDDASEVAGDQEGVIQRETKSCKHCKHHKHTDKAHDDDDGDGLSNGSTVSNEELSEREGLYVVEGLIRGFELGGSKVEQSTGLYDIVSYMTDNA